MTAKQIIVALVGAFLAGALGALVFNHWHALVHCWAGLMLCLCWLVGPDLILWVLLPLERATRPPRP